MTSCGKSHLHAAMEPLRYLGVAMVVIGCWSLAISTRWVAHAVHSTSLIGTQQQDRWNKSTIPHVIFHSTRVGQKTQAMDSWKVLNPQYTIRVLGDTDLEQFGKHFLT